MAWIFHTGDLPGPHDPGETTFEVTPLKIRNKVFLCSRHQRLFALDAETGRRCKAFGDNGTLDLKDGMGVKTLGF